MKSKRRTITDENGNEHEIKRFISYGDDSELFAVAEDGRLFMKRGESYRDTGEKICEKNNSD